MNKFLVLLCGFVLAIAMAAPSVEAQCARSGLFGGGRLGSRMADRRAARQEARAARQEARAARTEGARWRAFAFVGAFRASRAAANCE